MAIINFPTTPGVGDLYTFEGRRWRWNGTGWVSASLGVLTVSTTEPTSPAISDQWFDTNSGILYTYIEDDTAQPLWLELSAAGIGPTGSFLLNNTADQQVTGGYRVTVLDLGNSGTGTITPDPGDRPFQKYTNTGAHTLAPGSNYGSYQVAIVNGTGAGAIATSGWTRVAGDPFTTTVGHKFLCSAWVTGDGSALSVMALQ